MKTREVLRGALAQRRRAQARRLLHHRTRPFPQRGRRGRCSAAQPRRGAVVEPRDWRIFYSGANAARLRLPARLASRRRCCSPGRRALVRGWIDGVPLHIAKPHGDAAYFRSAKAALRTLHRAGITHNDLAKEQNWLYARRPRLSHRLPARVLFPPPQQRCSASRATRICAICSSTSAATRQKR